MSVKSITNAIVDEQLDIAAMADGAHARGKAVGARVKALAQNVVTMRAQGKITAQRAKELLREGMLILTLGEYSDMVGPMQELEDKALEAQQKALSSSGVALAQVPFVRSVDFAARVTEKEQEKLNGDGGPST